MPIKNALSAARWLWASLCIALGLRRRIRAYSAIEVVEAAPSLEDVEAAKLVVVRANGKDRWVMLRCPCGCNEVVTLSVQQAHRTHWTRSGSQDRPTLHPSIWRTEGCRSHFWILDGKVVWV